MRDRFDVFFSYHTVDHATVTRSPGACTSAAIRVFLDRWYLAAGQPWPQALERTLADCGAVAVFLGAEGLGPWQQRERAGARPAKGGSRAFPGHSGCCSPAPIPRWASSGSTPGGFGRGGAGDPGCRHSPSAAGTNRVATDRSRPRRNLPLPWPAALPRGPSRSSSAAPPSPRRWRQRSPVSRSSRSSARPAAASRRWCAPA